MAVCVCQLMEAGGWGDLGVGSLTVPVFPHKNRRYKDDVPCTSPYCFFEFEWDKSEKCMSPSRAFLEQVTKYFSLTYFYIRKIFIKKIYLKAFSFQM